MSGSVRHLDTFEAEDHMLDEIEPSKLVREFAKQLRSYKREQGLGDVRRAVLCYEPPWPEEDDVMRRWLVNRTFEIIDTDGIAMAILWLVASAWYEGGLAEMARSRASDSSPAAWCPGIAVDRLATTVTPVWRH